MEIVGQGGRLIDQHPHHDLLQEEILDEVLLLLARLDRERLRLINLCEREGEVRVRLKDNIDHWRLKRLQDLPLAVQKGLSFPSSFQSHLSLSRTRCLHHGYHRITMAYRLQCSSCR